MYIYICKFLIITLGTLFYIVFDKLIYFAFSSVSGRGLGSVGRENELPAGSSGEIHLWTK